MRRFSWSRWINPVYEGGTGTSSNNVEPLAGSMPDARGLPVLGTIASAIGTRFGSHLHEYVDKLHQVHGPLLRARIGPVESVFCCSARDMRQVFHLEGPAPRHFLPEAWVHYNEMRGCQRGLLFMDGDEWLNCRRKLNRVLVSSDSASRMIEPCREAAGGLVGNWRRFADSGQPVPELENQLYQYLMEVIIRNLTGSGKWPQGANQLPELLTEDLARNLRAIFENSVRLAAFPAKLARALRLPWWTNFVRSADIALSGVSGIVERLLEETSGMTDGMLVRMQAEGIADDELRRIVVDLVVAAGDVTAFSLQWLLYLLSVHQNIQDEIREQLQGLEGPEILQNPLLKAVIKESLRLYPTAPFIVRILPEDAFLGGFPVYKGELVVLSLYSAGRDEKNFSNAGSFVPQRWLRNSKGEYRGVHNPQASLPFAMGARSCIGRKLAETQMSLTISELVKHFRIDLRNKERVKVKLRMITAPSEPLQLILETRKS